MEHTIYVLDTSVLLAAGRQPLTAFAEHRVVLPLVVLKELESKRNDPELGLMARSALRALEEMRVQASDPDALKHGVEVTPEGGTLAIEVNHISTSGLPEALRDGSRDSRILAVATNLKQEGNRVVLISQDLPMRVLASGVLSLEAEEYRRGQAQHPGYPGVAHLEVSDETVAALYRGQPLDLSPDLPVNCGVIVTGANSSALARVDRDKQVVHVREQDAFGINGRSAEQRLALAHLLDPTIPIVSLGGPAGTGKTVLALAAGLDAVVERRTHKRIVVFRSPYAVGGQDLGALPGTEAEKMEPWAAAVWDALESICTPELIEEIRARRWLEVLPLTHVRGRTFKDTWVVVDEAQNLERPVILTALSRLGEGSKVVLSWDAAQRDNLHVGRHDGIHSVVELLKGEQLFAHVTLRKSERSQVAELVTRVLDTLEL